MKDGYGYACKDCIYAYRVEKRARDGLPPFKRKSKQTKPQRKIEIPSGTKEYYADTHLWSLYRITSKDKEKIFQDQGNCCGICKKTETTEKGWCVDHDHETGKVRGVLCHHCNSAIGSLREDVNIMQNAIDYIKKYSVVSI